MTLDQTHLFETKEKLNGLDGIRLEGENLEKMNIKQLQDLLDKVEKLEAGKDSIILNIPEGFLGFYERDWGSILNIPSCIKNIVFPSTFIGIRFIKSGVQFLPKNKGNIMFPKGKYIITTEDYPCTYGILGRSKAKKLLSKEISCIELLDHADEWGSLYGVEFLQHGTCFTINRVASFDSESEVLESHTLEISSKTEVSLDGFPIELSSIESAKSYIHESQFPLNKKLLVFSTWRETYGIEHEFEEGFSLDDIIFGQNRPFCYEDVNSKKTLYGFANISIKCPGDHYVRGSALTDAYHEYGDVFFNGKLYEPGPELLSAIEKDIAQENEAKLERKRKLEEKKKNLEEIKQQEKQHKEEEKKREASFANKPKETMKFMTVKTNDLEIKFGSLMKYKGKETEIALPSTVERIWAAAFAGNKSLKAVEIPESVFDIQTSAFQGCSGLETINLPDNIKSIAEKTFSGCSSLKEITIPESVIRICEEAFSNCTSLTKENIHCDDWINKDDLLAGKKLEKI
ncbi:leucine-rich repeat domain-containing protein [Treponema sp.]|uniref:leucine-rich repeat domain-containing protein n=1 Tax=Treponema sp. TaxID=166 RepID=UPI00388EA958